MAENENQVENEDEVFYKDFRSFGRLFVKFIILFVIGLCFVESIKQSTIIGKKLTKSKVWESFERFHHQSTLTQKWFGVEQQLLKPRQNILDNESLAKYLHREVRVLCWALTEPKHHNHTIHMRQTWGRRCNHFVLISTVYEANLNLTVLNDTESQSGNIWLRTVAAYKYLYINYRNTIDWFYKADDFTYTIMENLRLMLYRYSPQTAIYFGCRFDDWPKQSYTGGFGAVLSKEALSRLVKYKLSDQILCPLHAKKKLLDGINEHDKLENCLQNLNIIVGDTRDERGARRVLPTRWQNQLMAAETYREEWSAEYAFFKLYEGPKCCSKHFVTFHYMRPPLMYSFEYLLYYLRPYGVAYEVDALPQKLAVSKRRRTQKKTDIEYPDY